MRSLSPRTPRCSRCAECVVALGNRQENLLPRGLLCPPVIGVDLLLGDVAALLRELGVVLVLLGIEALGLGMVGRGALVGGLAGLAQHAHPLVVGLSGEGRLLLDAAELLGARRVESRLRAEVRLVRPARGLRLEAREVRRRRSRARRASGPAELRNDHLAHVGPVARRGHRRLPGRTELATHEGRHAGAILRSEVRGQGRRGAGRRGRRGRRVARLSHGSEAREFVRVRGERLQVALARGARRRGGARVGRRARGRVDARRGRLEARRNTRKRGGERRAVIVGEIVECH